MMNHVEREEFDALVSQMEECKTGVHKDIKELKLGHRELKEAIDGQSVERKTFNTEVKAMIDEVMTEVKEHTKDEMETIKKIHTVLDTLVKQTAENTGFISSTIQNEELERRVAEKMNNINKPRQEMWHKVKMTALTVVTGFVVTAVGSGIWVIVKMWMMMNGQEVN